MYIGIDLGTTNSVICSYDGENVRIWKSPEQSDVTPSAIYINKRGGKLYGQGAYNNAPRDPKNSAMLFKRLMGTSTKINFEYQNIVMTPEECSSEILRVLFGYLPEDIREHEDTTTVITVPASFNQMQKDSTMEAAHIAGIGKVALMQEPVAAIMSVTRATQKNGIFIVYDLGGGTFDISIAECIGGRVNLLAQGGKGMCGGRDFDRILFDNITIPWIKSNFSLPVDFRTNDKYKVLLRLAIWATERAKIDLSSKDESSIRLDEVEIRTVDESGKDIYLDILINRKMVNEFIGDMVNDTIESTRDVLSKVGLKPEDVEKIVFVGGPTNYKPLRDKVSYELGITSNIDINPMTAVAEGAAIFAESIDWSSKSHNRKPSQGELKSTDEVNISFKYSARTTDDKTKIVAVFPQNISGFTYQINNIDTGWTSGKLPLMHGVNCEINLSKNGDNNYEIMAYDKDGKKVKLNENKIVISKTTMTVGTIPASHSIGVEVLNKIGGIPVLDYLVKAGDSLPKKCKSIFKATQALKSGSNGSINFKLWEGEISNPIEYNRFVGALKISGNDFDSGIITIGCDLECQFEMSDSGNIYLEVSIPSIGSTFNERNFYSRQEGQLDYEKDLDKIIDDAEKVLKRIDDISEKVSDPKLEDARKKLEKTISLDASQKDAEITQEANESVLDAKRTTAQVIKENLKDIRQLDLNNCVEFFNSFVRQYTKPIEEKSFENLSRTAQRSIDNNDNGFENQIDGLKQINFDILWRQDWFVIDRFKDMTQNPNMFEDLNEFMNLKRMGHECVENDDIIELRNIVINMYKIRMGNSSFELMNDVTNITKG